MNIMWRGICVVNWNLLVILCIVILCSECYGLDTGTVAPLSSDNPASSEKIIDNKDLKKIETRFNDPPPEYYKGPSNGANHYDSYDLKYNGQSYRPSANIASASGHINPYLSKHGFYGPINPKDRISIGGGYYSGSEFSGAGGVGGGGGGYSSERVRPYGSPQPVDIPANGLNSHNYYNGHGYDDSQGLDWSHGGNSISGGGGGVSGYGYGNSWSDKMHHLSKSHFVPLAGAALLGIAAALLVNPVLLQLGTVTGKRRRKRNTKKQTLTTASSARGQRLAYSGQRPKNN